MTYNTICIIINNTINDSVTLIKWRAWNRKYHFKFTHAHTNIIKHEHVFLHKQTNPQLRKDRVLLVNYFHKIETLNCDGKLCAHWCVQCTDTRMY